MIQQLFYQRNEETRKIEEYIFNKVKEFLKVLKTKKLTNFIETFGIVGSASTGNATIYGSDVDFYMIPKYFNPIKERIIENIFSKIFQIDYPLIHLFIDSPRRYKIPNLLLLDYCHNGIHILGKPNIKKLRTNTPPKWTGINTIVGKIVILLKNIRITDNKFIITIDDDFTYNYSKTIIALGNALLLIKQEFEFNRNKQIKKIIKSELAKEAGVSDKITEAIKLRYEPSKIDYKKKEEMFRYLIKTVYKSLKILLREYFNEKDLTKIKSKLRRTHPELITLLYTRIKLTIKYYKITKKLYPHTLTEPYTNIIINLLDLLEEINKKNYSEKIEKIRKKIIDRYLGESKFLIQDYPIKTNNQKIFKSSF